MKGEFYADLDQETGMYCVFHTDYEELGYNEGFAFSSWGSMRDAERDAEKRNKSVIQSEIKNKGFDPNELSEEIMEKALKHGYELENNHFMAYVSYTRRDYIDHWFDRGIIYTFQELMDKLTNILSESDPSYLVEIYNQVSSIRVKNIGNRLFEEESREKKVK